MRKLETIWRNMARNLASKAGGAEIAETAMILPLLFVFVMAIFWFGQAFRIYGAITHAAREGARAAVAPACSTCAATSSVQNATTAVSNALIAADLDPALTAAPSPAPTFLACSGNTAVSCQHYNTSGVCVYSGIQLSNTAQGGTEVCGAAVMFTYKYPFHFTLPCWPQPCTSLDLQKLTLPAQAQMRLETQ